MGVPKFFRWLSERYPLINQRHGVRPSPELIAEHFENPKSPSDYLPPPDPLSECGLPPAVDRLYIDMNGIIHGASHNNVDEGEGGGISEEETFNNISYYLDRIVKEIAQPSELIYLAIDGVAPRAKLNQQRARRYRSGQEGEIEQTVYDAHLKAISSLNGSEDDDSPEGYDDEIVDPVNGDNGWKFASSQNEAKALVEIQPGRFAGKFETHAVVGDADPPVSLTTEPEDVLEDAFHSNTITPGTPFFQRCTDHLEAFIRRKMATDPDWQKLTVIFSGPNTPGEGEHKIMQFIREQQKRKDYEPNKRHCIMGQDGDLIMLGLVTHEPNLVLLREQVLFDKKRTQSDSLSATYGLDTYIFNPNFEFLHMNVLRDYLAYEFATSNVVIDSSFDIERTIDDFVFLTFFVGNDFLPHMPALDIADEAFDLLFYAYRGERKKWLAESEAEERDQPYLTDSGNIVSGKRLEQFLSVVGSHESPYYSYKESTKNTDQLRKLEAKYGMNSTPSDEVIESKEASDRARFRELVAKSIEDRSKRMEAAATTADSFAPVLSANFVPESEEEEASLFARMGSLLENSVSKPGSKNVDEASASPFDDKDVKGRYYADKFGFSPFDAEKHIALRKAYMEGLVWNLKYYYQGCVSWEWYYPYHYGPMISDLVGLDEILEEISFEDKMGQPLKPFEQLMACLPPSFAHLLPEPYRWLMKEESSPIFGFYPPTFTVDMNGKRWPWEAVVLLPFIDSKRLLDAANTVDETLLTPEEKKRNSYDTAYVFTCDEGATEEDDRDISDRCTVVRVPFDRSSLCTDLNGDAPVFRPVLHPAVEFPLPGLATLRSGLVQGMKRKNIRVNIHGSPSRYTCACLELRNSMPEILPVDTLAPQLVGTCIYTSFPYLTEAFVTAVSDDRVIVRGNDDPRPLDPSEATERPERLNKIIESYSRGQKLVGTGGLFLAEGGEADLSVLLHVRPFMGLKKLSDGTTVRTFAKFEVEVPLFVTSWYPMKGDPRLLGVPVALEKDPYNAAKFILTKNGGSKKVYRGKKPRVVPLGRRLPPAFHSRPLNARSFYSSPMLPSVAVEWGLQNPFFSITSPQQIHRRDHGTKIHRVVSSTTGRPIIRIAVGAVLALFFSVGVQSSLFNPISHKRTRAFDPSCFRFDSQSLESSESGIEYDPQGRSDVTDDAATTPPLEFAHGTTTLAFAFSGGIVAAVDSRASLGNFVGSKTTQKVLPIHSHMLATMAGGAADCSILIRKIRAEASLHQLLQDGKRMSVARASRLLSNILYENRAFGLSMGTMVMGFNDGAVAEPKIFYIDNTGLRIEGDLFSVGSGSTYALGILDIQERRKELTANEAVALGIKAIRHATFRDAYSGGFINVYLITKEEGWRRVFTEDVAQLKG